MRVVIQRVNLATVRVGDEVVGAIGRGLLVFIGIHREDTDEDLDWILQKIVQVRVFEDEEGKMNRSVMEISGDVMLISQFTLFGKLRKGTRPSFNRAASPEIAIPIYESAVKKLSFLLGKAVATGRFGEHMDIRAQNDGPVTLVIDSHEKRF